MERSAREAQKHRRRLIGLALAGVLAALVGVAVFTNLSTVLDGLTLKHMSNVPPEIRKGWHVAVFNPIYWSLVAIFVVLERLFPAEPGTSALTRGGGEDLIWILGAPLFAATFVALWSGTLSLVYSHVFGGHVIDLDHWLGRFGAVVVAFVIADFLAWFSHYLRHRVPTFWYFHAVHHAARQLNVLTDWRVHFMEAVISATIVVLPARALGLDTVAATELAIATTYFTAFSHTAVRTNLGPLRWLLVTPQSHRVHHSDAPEHIDKNFATVFSVWDRLFGTQYLGEDEYPSTGIVDPAFPRESEGRGVPALVGVYLRQIAYPFRQVAGDFGKSRRVALPPQ